MSIFPKTRDDWIAAPLLPFKAWVLLGYALFFILRPFVTHRVAWGMGFWVTNGYVLSVGVLLIGALVQSIVCSRGAATRTILYVLGAIIILACGLGCL